MPFLNSITTPARSSYEEIGKNYNHRNIGLSKPQILYMKSVLRDNREDYPFAFQFLSIRIKLNMTKLMKTLETSSIVCRILSLIWGYPFYGKKIYCIQ